MPNCQYVYLEVMGCILVNIFFIKHVVPKLCHQILKKQFDDLTQKKRNKINLHAAILLYTSVASGVSVYVLLSDTHTFHERLWKYSDVALCNLAMAVGFSVADIYVRLTWELKLCPSMYIHNIFAVAILGYVALIHETMLYFASVRIFTAISVPFFAVRIILQELGKKNYVLWSVSLGEIFVYFYFRIILIPFHYYVVLYEADPQQMDYLVFWGWLVGGVTLDVIYLYWFGKLLMTFWSLGTSQKVEKNREKLK
ncbi:TLC domain-containing protein 4-like [Clavelina lepadiformis]|uniref:TLC domain-containing protein n=1 Tax=Clavelina lepadiformis TaxID=159417 RepID=A0ABP0FJ32_CLALP